MPSKLTTATLVAMATAAGFEPAALAAIQQVEGSGAGFDAKTGKILIQFEPNWFRRYFNNVWVPNGVQPQGPEWVAFNKAWRLPGVDKATRATAQTAAMLSTSWGAFQIMGFHFRRLGFANVGEFVDYQKLGEVEQLECLIRFINSDTKYVWPKDKGGDGKTYTLAVALGRKVWGAFAYRYNGSNYAVNDYDGQMSKWYRHFAVQPEYQPVLA